MVVLVVQKIWPLVTWNEYVDASRARRTKKYLYTCKSCIDFYTYLFMEDTGQCSIVLSQRGQS
jgi:hypothetical protein